MTETKNYPNTAQSFGITGIVILGMLLLSPLYIVFINLIGKEASMLIYYILSVGIPFWIVYTIRRRKTGKRSFNLSIENKRIIPFIVLGTIAILFGIASPLGNLIPMSEKIKQAFGDFGSMTGIYSFIMMVVAAPILEELIFRGIILDGLLKNYLPIKAILISSLLFGIVHLNPWQFVTAFTLGIFAGWIYYETRSLSATIIVHATANLSGFTMRIFMSDDSLPSDSLTEMYSGITNLVLLIVGSIIVLAGCVFFLNKEFLKRKIAAEKV